MTPAPPVHLRACQVQVSLASRDDEAEGLRSAAHNAQVKAAAAEAEVAQLRVDAAAAAAERDAVAARVEQLTVDLAAATAGSDLTDQRVSGLEEALRHAEERLRHQATVETEQEAQIAALSTKLEAAHATVEALKEQVRPVLVVHFIQPPSLRQHRACDVWPLCCTLQAAEAAGRAHDEHRQLSSERGVWEEREARLQADVEHHKTRATELEQEVDSLTTAHQQAVETTQVRDPPQPGSIGVLLTSRGRRATRHAAQPALLSHT